MRRLSFLLIFLLMLAACSSDDDADTEIDEPTPVATEIVDEEAPEPTPTAEPTPEPTPEPTATATPEPEEAFDLDAFVDGVVENVVELRGLELLEELQFAVMSRQELTEFLEEEIQIEQVEIDSYWLLRLLDDRDIDLERIMIDAQAADIYGFYDTETKETYVIAEDEELSAMEEVFLAHEITHALQDQHFDLSLLDSEDSDYDRMLAFLSMVEGDAVLTQELYAQSYLDADRQMEYQQEALAVLQNPDAMAAFEALPNFIVQNLAFPYTAGPQFMLQVFDGDLNSLNEYLTNPPVSTQQVIYPGQFLEGEIEPPVTVEIEDFHDRLGESWEILDEGTFGIFDLILILEENGVADPETPVAGWRGSQFAMYDDGEEVAVVVSSAWDSPESAGAFEAALVETMSGYAEEEGVWSDGERFHAISIEDTTVTLKSSSNEEALRSII